MSIISDICLKIFHVQCFIKTIYLTIYIKRLKVPKNIRKYYHFCFNEVIQLLVIIY